MHGPVGWSTIKSVSDSPSYIHDDCCYKKIKTFQVSIAALSKWTQILTAATYMAMSSLTYATGFWVFLFLPAEL